MPRLQCNQGQQKGTSHSDRGRKRIEECLHMEKKDWVEEMRSDQRDAGRGSTERRAEEEEERLTHSRSARIRTSSISSARTERSPG